MTPLMYACQHKRSKLAQLLLTKESDVNHQDIRGWTVSGCTVHVFMN